LLNHFCLDFVIWENHDFLRKSWILELISFKINPTYEKWRTWAISP
jgi:hypothetical protein